MIEPTVTWTLIDGPGNTFVTTYKGFPLRVYQSRIGGWGLVVDHARIEARNRGHDLFDSEAQACNHGMGIVDTMLVHGAKPPTPSTTNPNALVELAKLIAALGSGINGRTFIVGKQVAAAADQFIKEHTLEPVASQTNKRKLRLD